MSVHLSKLVLFTTILSASLIAVQATEHNVKVNAAIKHSDDRTITDDAWLWSNPTG